MRLRCLGEALAERALDGRVKLMVPEQHGGKL
jgi:hypothetical protein